MGDVDPVVLLTNFTSPPVEADDAGNLTDECPYYETSNVVGRFYASSVFGGIVAMIGVGNNVLLVYLLLRRCQASRSHMFYLSTLAVCDALTETCYLLVFSVDKVWMLWQSLELSRVWHSYIRFVYAMAQASLTAGVYMMMAASFERYMVSTSWLQRDYSFAQRLLVVSVVVSFALLFKGSCFFELQVVRRTDCTGIGSIYLSQTDLYSERTALAVEAVRQLFCVFVPFVTLVYLNYNIMISAKRTLAFRGWATTLQSTAMMRIAVGARKTKEHQAVVRANTRMLVATVVTYFATNSLNLVITVWERIDMDGLRARPEFYTYATDFITLTTMTAGVMRLPLYCIYNKQVRHELGVLLAGVDAKAARHRARLHRASHRHLAMIRSASGALSSAAVEPVEEKLSVSLSFPPPPPPSKQSMLYRQIRPSNFDLVVASNHSSSHNHHCHQNGNGAVVGGEPPKTTTTTTKLFFLDQNDQKLTSRTLLARSQEQWLPSAHRATIERLQLEIVTYDI